MISQSFFNFFQVDYQNCFKGSVNYRDLVFLNNVIVKIMISLEHGLNQYKKIILFLDTGI